MENQAKKIKLEEKEKINSLFDNLYLIILYLINSSFDNKKM